MKSRKKWIVLGVVAAVLVVVLVLALVLPAGGGGERVYVYSIDMIGMTDYNDYSSQSSGMVTTDRVQPVYLTTTQTVTEVLVTEGQQVKKGDVLFTYDTTLSELQLRRKDLSIQQLKVNLTTAKEELKAIKALKPIVYRPTTATKATTTAPKETGIGQDTTGQDYLIYAGTGRSASAPKYCWLRIGTLVDTDLITDLFTGITGNTVYVVFQHTEKNAGDGEILDSYGVQFLRKEVQEEPAPTEPTDPSEPPTDPEDPTRPPEGTEDTQPDGVSTPNVGAYTLTDEKTTVYTYSMAFFEPPATPVVEVPDTNTGDNVDWNSGYTSSEIASMREEKEDEIKKLEFEIKMAESEYKIMQKEADAGKVTAEFDGVVVGLQDPETARMNSEPMLKVSGGGGFYIEGTVSELELSSLEVGQEVEVQSWTNWETCTGVITEIGQYPADDGNQYYASSNVSYYPYKVFVDESADLQDGYWVDLTLHTAATEEPGLYVMNAFVLTEEDGSYVYVRGADDKLEKRAVQAGRDLYGYYTQILGGLEETDYLAFPYGRDVKNGAPTAEGDWDTLYGD